MVFLGCFDCIYYQYHAPKTNHRRPNLCTSIEFFPTCRSTQAFEQEASCKKATLQIQKKGKNNITHQFNTQLVSPVTQCAASAYSRTAKYWILLSNHEKPSETRQAISTNHHEFCFAVNHQNLVFTLQLATFAGSVSSCDEKNCEPKLDTSFRILVGEWMACQEPQLPKQTLILLPKGIK